MITARLDAQETEQQLSRIAGKLRNLTPLHKTWGNSVAKTARNAARAKGGKHFWDELARAISVSEISDSGATVSADHYAAAQKQYGGEIRPKNAKALTIPISPEAKGKRASEFAGRDLFVIKSKSPDTKGILGYSSAGQFVGLFVLRTRVRQKADPFWPDESTTLRLGLAEAEFWLKKQTEN